MADHEATLFDRHCPPDVKEEWWAFIMWEFWLTEGIESPDQKARMVGIGRDRTMFRDPGVMGSRIDELSELLELDRKAATRLVVRAPMLPTRDIGSLKTKIEQLNAVLPNSVKMRSMIRRVPTLLYKDINNNITTHMDDLVELLPGYNVQKIVEDQPTLLYSDVRTTVARNLENLREIMPDVDLQRLVEATPSLLNTRIERTVKPKLKRLRVLVGDEQMSKWIEHPVSLGRALRCSHKVIDRLQYIKDERISQRFSAITILTMTEARFLGEHPEFVGWAAARPGQSDKSPAGAQE